MLGTEHRRRLPRAEREEQLLGVAQALFAEHGFRALSMDEIALQAGVTKPVLYDHFGSKDGLIAACIRHAGGQLLRDVDAAVAKATGVEQILADGFAAFFGFVESFGQGWFMLIGENSVVGPAAEALESIRRQQAAYVAQKLAASSRVRGGTTCASSLRPSSGPASASRSGAATGPTCPPRRPSPASWRWCGAGSRR